MAHPLPAALPNRVAVTVVGTFRPAVARSRGWLAAVETACVYCPSGAGLTPGFKPAVRCGTPDNMLPAYADRGTCLRLRDPHCCLPCAAARETARPAPGDSSLAGAACNLSICAAACPYRRHQRLSATCRLKGRAVSQITRPSSPARPSPALHAPADCVRGLQPAAPQWRLGDSHARPRRPVHRHSRSALP